MYKGKRERKEFCVMTKWMTICPAVEPPPFRGITPGWSSNKDGPLYQKAQNKTSHFEGRDTPSYLIVAGLCVMVHECVCMQPCNHSDQFQRRHWHPEDGMKQQSPLCARQLFARYTLTLDTHPENPVFFKLDIVLQKSWSLLWVTSVTIKRRTLFQTYSALQMHAQRAALTLRSIPCTGIYTHLGAQ